MTKELETLQTETAVSILTIFPNLMRIVTAELRREELAIMLPQVFVLNHLLDGPKNLSQLAELNVVSLPTMSGTVAKLVKEGHCARKRSETDRRVVMIEITTKGLDLLDNVGQKMIARLSIMLNNVDKAQLETIYTGLTMLHKAII